MAVLGTVLAAAFLLFVWFLYGKREIHPKNSIKTSSRNLALISNFKFTCEKGKVETERTDAQNLSINSGQTLRTDILRTGNSWKSNKISSTQDSDINNTVIGANSSVIQESQNTQDSMTIENEDNSLTRINTRSESMYFSGQVPNEYNLKISTLESLECAITPTSLENPLSDGVLSKDVSSSTHSLSALETGITVTDMTAEVPSALKTASVLKLDSLLEVDCLTTTDKT
ncbi:hypothetical protein LOAG_09762 [Loa loa]|uniref:Uncharacterized protein n=1 Tax=Loa loa TaxID=7209 RepID=A0A1S0TRD7_LOALO|nr:hypothetical protein LOAG_09762 [Loa loa]EFO18736.2 hypothetical protein LOAG_09762 [Loa loa]